MSDTCPALLVTGPPLFATKTPTLLTINASGTHLTVAGTQLPLRNLSVSSGLRAHELVFTSRRTVLCVLPVPAHEQQLVRFQRSLRLACLSPPGYRLLAEIGKGAFGVVYSARCLQTGEFRAVKMVSKSGLKRANVPLHVARNELVIAQSLAPHPSVVYVHEVQENSAYFIVVMDLARGGSLFEYAATRDISAQVISHIMLQLLNAISHLHCHRIIHRDVKLENILVKDADAEWPQIIVVDLGLATDAMGDASDETLTMRVGTEYAQAPEMIRSNAQNGYGPAVDVWACGIVLFALLYGRLPWMNDRKLQLGLMDNMHSQSKAGKSSIHVIQTLEERLRTPRALHSLLCGLLQPDVNRRLTARAALEHTIFATMSDAKKKTVCSPRPSSPRSLRDATFRVMNVMRVVDNLQLQRCDQPQVQA